MRAILIEHRDASDIERQLEERKKRERREKKTREREREREIILNEKWGIGNTLVRPSPVHFEV